MLGQLQSQIFFGKSSGEVSDENYILSKLDINYDNLTREKIDELV
jgi:hypothetical protein